MSSILDALNKLEQEKAQSSREAERADTDPVSVANDLVGRSVMRERVTLRVTPAGLLLSVGALVVGLVVITFAAAVMFTSGRAATPTANEVTARAQITDSDQSAAPASARTQITDLSAAPAASARTQITDLSATPAPTAVALPPPAPPVAAAEMPKASVVTPATTPDKSAAAVVEKSEPAPPPVVENKPVPQTVAAQPAPRAKTDALVQSEDTDSPAAEESEPAPPPVKVAKASPRVRPTTKSNDASRLPGPEPAPVRASEVSLESLPTLTPVEQTRFGFMRLKVNMVKPAGDTNPRGSAILSFVEEGADGQAVPNRMRFYEGERIQNSALRVFKIGPDRVGIEDMRTGDRYQLPI